MVPSTVPRIESRWVCISARGQAALAAVISSYVRDSGVYFLVFEFPNIDVPYSPSSDFGKDGYLGRVLGDRAAHQVNNCLARIQPDTILLLGMTENEKSYLRARLPAERLIEIDTLAELSSKLPFSKPEGEPVRCKSSQLIEGLLLAKFSHRTLAIDESAEPLTDRHVHGGDGILLIEADGAVTDVAAINYAFAIDADVVVVPGIDKHQVRQLPRQLQAWSKDKSHYEFQWAKHAASKRIKGVDFSPYKFATFFTEGLPYGLFIKNAIPCSHVMAGLDCGLFIANALIEEHAPSNSASALVFSPELFDSEETGDVCKIVDNDKYTVTRLLGKSATVKNLTNYGSYFPYDIMHICAHGGETNGYFVVQEFKDREGAPHKIEFYEVVGFSPAGGEMVSVHRKAIFKAFDGFPWMSSPLKRFPRYIFEDLMKALKLDSSEKVNRVSFNSPIALSCHIQCADSIHQGQFLCLAGFSHPVVFNNTCSSSHEIALTIIHAGARAYIGTLWSVGNKTAKHAAKVFYEELVRQRNLLTAFFAMSKAVVNQQYQDVYIFWGLHFSTLPWAMVKSDSQIFDNLLRQYLSWLRKIETTPDAEVRRNSIPIARFLSEELARRFTKERLDGVKAFDPSKLDQQERGALEEINEFSRGASEVEIE